MNKVKFALMAAAGFIGLASAFANTQRVTFTYVNTASGFVKIASYNPARCLNPSVIPCRYQSSVDLGATTTQHQLTLVAAIPSSEKKIYVLP